MSISIVSVIAVGAAILILLIAAAAAFGMSRQWKFASPGRFPRPRHWITRVICGTLGGAIVLAFVVGTVRDARGPYLDRGSMSVRLPALPLAEIPSPEIKGRFLVHAVLASWYGEAMVPIQAETFEARWPQDEGRIFRGSYREGTSTVTYELSLFSMAWHRDVDGRPELQIYGSRSLKVERPGSYSSSSGSMEFPRVQSLFNLRGSSGMFSVASSGAEGQAILFDVTPIREEDPLRNGTFREFLAIRSEVVWTKLTDDAVSSDHTPPRSIAPAGMLLQTMGPSILFLAAAAILLGQLFTRRSIGTVKMAACLLLFVGALDRLALRIHESKLRDAAAPVERRLIACNRLTSTSFFRETALRDLDRTAADPAAPKPLQGLARRLAERERRNHFP